MRRPIAFLAAVSLLAAGTGAFAAPCKDSKGKFIKCPAPAASTATRCINSATKKFAKCGTPGAMPMK